MLGRAALPLALTAAFLVGKSAEAKDKPAGKITTTCALLADGARCKFENAGAPTRECLRVLIAPKGSASVVASDEVCSGTVPQGGAREAVVRFPRRPREVCGKELGCATRQVSAGNIDAEARAWQGELRSEIKKNAPPDKTECKKISEHYFELYAKYYDQIAVTEEEREQMRTYVRDYKQTIIDGFMYTCEGLSRKQANCTIKASDFDAFNRCLYEATEW